MKGFRFAIAVLALGFAAAPQTGQALEQSCPMGVVYGPPWGTCAYTGHGSCRAGTCEYECENSWTGVIEGVCGGVDPEG